MATAIPLCIPDICSWNESSQQYIRHKQKRTERDSLIVVEAARRRLRAINGPVCVVTIAGPCRKGKSSILSKAFDQGEVFPLGHLLDPETMGIWMWVVPQKFTDNNGREFTVVLLDSEGINAVTAENKDDHKIFTLSVLLASVLIYNSSGVPNRTDLEGLDYISQLSQRIHLRATNQNERGEKRPNFNKTFPYFLWLLRDVLLDLPSDCSTIKDYFLKRVFNSELDSNDKAGDVAESILDLFQGFDAFALPLPSYNSNVVKRLNDHNVQNQLNPEFISRVQEFSTFLRSKLCPKTSFNDGEYVTGEALAALVDIYVETLNTPGAVPNVQKAWEVFIQSKCSESSIAALKVYEETMSSVQEAIPCANDKVYRYHSAAWDRCLNLFKCETDCISAVTADRYLKDLTAETDKMFKHWMETNRRTTKDTCEQLLSQLKKSILDPVLIKLTSGEASSLTFEDIVQTYNSIESKFKTQARGAEDVCASVFANFQPHLNAEMQKHVKYLQQLKNYDANIAKEREERAKEEEQRKLFEEQVKMLEQRKRQVEKECKIMAEKKEKDEERLREQHQQQLRAQEEQHRNMMEAHMDKLRREREAMEAQRDNTGDIIKMMGDMMKSRDQELTQLTQAVMEVANRPPTVIEKDSGGGFLSILPETIKAIGSIFVKK